MSNPNPFHTSLPTGEQIVRQCSNCGSGLVAILAETSIAECCSCEAQFDLPTFDSLLIWRAPLAASETRAGEQEGSTVEPEIKPHSSVLYTDLTVRCHGCKSALVWRYLEDIDEIEVFHEHEAAPVQTGEGSTPDIVSYRQKINPRTGELTLDTFEGRSTGLDTPPNPRTDWVKHLSSRELLRRLTPFPLGFKDFQEELLSRIEAAASVQGEGIAPMKAEALWQEWVKLNGYGKMTMCPFADFVSERNVAAQAAEIAEMMKNQEREYCGGCDHGVVAGKVCESCRGTGYKERRSEDLASQLTVAQQERDDLKEHLRTIEVDYVEKRNRLANAVKRAEAAETLVGELRTGLEEIMSWKHDQLFGDYTVGPEHDGFQRGARMAFYRCATRAKELLTSTLKVKPKASRVMSPEGHPINRRGPMMKDCYKKL